MKSKLWEKPLTWKKVLLILLLLVAVGLISFLTSISIFCMLNHNNANQEKCEECKKCPEEKECEKTENLYDETIISASVSLNNNFTFPSPCSNLYPYSSDFVNKFYGTGIKLEEFSKDDLITSAAYQISNLPICNNEKAEITVDEINYALEKKFNSPNIKITLNDLKNYQGQVGFEVDNDKIYVSSGNCDGCGPGLFPYNIKKVEKQELNGNNLYIYYRVARLQAKAYEENGESGIYYETYKASDFEQKNVIEEIQTEEKITWSKYSLYKVTYELIDATLYFRAIEIIEK